MTRLAHSELGRNIDDFLVFKRALGYPYHRGEATLRSFQRFAQLASGGQHTEFDLASTIEAWLKRIARRKPVTIATDLGSIRQLCLHRRRYDPDAFVPDVAWAPCTESKYQPYVFSRDEVRSLIEAAGRYQHRNIWPGMLRMLLLVLYCTGVRFGEAARLQLADVDLDRGVLFIRQSKGRSRLVPFRSDLTHEFAGYLHARSEMTNDALAASDAVFVGRNGRAISTRKASEAVRCLLRQLGIKAPRGRAGPRPYDFRHAFAVHRLTDWYARGVNIQAQLPWLSAYMGHVNVLGTEDYLHATAELLEVASSRFSERVNRVQMEP